MNTDLTEEEMREALFGSLTPTPRVNAPVTPPPVADIAPAPSIKTLPKKKAVTAFTPLLRVTMQVTNEFEGQTFELIHEADTLSTLLAEQQAVKVAKKKYRYVEVVSVKPM